MALAAGSRLGAYEVVSLLGEGGMGQVYRAKDTRLKRDVALKILPEAFAGDPDRVARFQREAELLAALNHPNIAGIYGLEDDAGVRAIVLELIEGETLADRIARGPIPIDEALLIARQIIDALETAHDRGVIHRDLKPANVKVTSEGRVKVLDFGLAKMLEPAAPATALSRSPTQSVQATYAGVILGTAAYMSPEQARGKPLDRRTDVWAFGCVLFEMLAGRQAFERAGDTVSDVLAAVLTKEPDWTSLPAGTPPHIESLLRRCLQKEIQRRVPHIGVARLEIDEPSTPPSLPTSTPAPERSWWRRAVPFALGVLITAVVDGAVWWRSRTESPPTIVTRFSIPLSEGQNFSNAGRQVLAISPDGTQIVYSAASRLYLRTMADLEARPIPGIDGSYAVIGPVFSPDGRSIAFWSGADGTLKRIAVTGGAPVTIAAIPNPVGMSWGPEGILAGESAQGVLRLSPSGGTSDVLVAIKDDEVAHGPQMLPGGRAVLFTLAKATASPDRWDKAKIVVQSLGSGERKVLIDGGSDARYVPTGHLVYALSGVVLAVPFNVRTLQVLGGPVPIVEGVRRAGGAVTGSAQFSVAANGSLVYLSGPVSTSSADRELAVIDRTGKATSLKLPPGAIDHPRISPDGKRVAFVIDDDKGAVVWTYELSGATAMHRVTFNGNNRFPIWTEDGKRVVFQSDRDGDRGIFWQPADGSGAPQRLTMADKDTEHIPESWSPKGGGFLFRVTKGNVNTLSFFSMIDRKVTPFGAIESAAPTNARFSPDGRWVAYETRANRPPARGVGTGPTGVIDVQPFPPTGPIYQVPAVEQGGYRHPVWSPDGREMFFMIGGNIRLRVVPVKTQPDFVFGNAASLPRPSYWMDVASDNGTQWDVLPDGQRFIIRAATGLVGQPDTVSPIQQIQIVLNWTEELKQRALTK
jgi:serine/threonine-protein kinase